MSQEFPLAEWRVAGAPGPVAVLVDGSDIGHQAAQRILDLAEALGPVTIRRVYADVTRQKDWSGDTRFNPIHSVHRGEGQANVFLVMDALQFGETGRAASFVIASGNPHMVPVIRRLRDLGCAVQGVSFGQPSADLQAACSWFEVLEAAPAD